MSTSTADSERLKETAESLHLNFLSIFYYPALFSAHTVNFFFSTMF